MQWSGAFTQPLRADLLLPLIQPYAVRGVFSARSGKATASGCTCFLRRPGQWADYARRCQCGHRAVVSPGVSAGGLSFSWPVCCYRSELSHLETKSH